MRLSCQMGKMGRMSQRESFLSLGKRISHFPLSFPFPRITLIAFCSYLVFYGFSFLFPSICLIEGNKGTMNVESGWGDAVREVQNISICSWMMGTIYAMFPYVAIHLPECFESRLLSLWFGAWRRNMARVASGVVFMLTCCVDFMVSQLRLTLGWSR